MPVKPELLEILACPACGGGLTQPDEESLVCEKCGRKYPVQDGIPSLIVEDSQQG